MWQEYKTPSSPQEVVELLAQNDRARIVAGGTDLILEIERGIRKDVDTLIDVTRIPNLDRITLDEDGVIHLGAMVTHNHVAGSKLMQECAYPLVRACWEVGANQIRNRATVAGNLVTASPANDTITPLMALGTSVTLLSTKGERTVALKDFYQGVRKTVMRQDEMLVDISFPALTESQRGTFIKLALRRAQAICVINVAIVLDMHTSTTLSTSVATVKSAAITLGAVSPVIIHAEEAETYLVGKELSEDVIAEAANLAMQAARPIGDIRGSAEYRREMVRVNTARGLRSLRDGQEQVGFPSDPVLLWGKSKTSKSQPATYQSSNPIITTINESEYVIDRGHDKTLLDFLREELGMMGSKEGCGEGECGACTVYLDGKAVMACLVPAPRAHGAEIMTIEGLAGEAQEQLHPVQEAFIHDGAVQCGFCTPGFIMSAAKLLEERPKPTRNQIEQAISGNICRCTGYYKIVEAIENASQAK
ncbi:MAG: 2Fe-2S iron-sulfur cluster binding domain-containing protein [Anaerolineae bacterium]|jgi:xanthine dehydrogenase iron-sulfur cluster and FAD-binding subunit A|nr:2Fe-2S iron-sulfur cluster binding domain-containing protein [Anaerolineae bacterium]MBT7071553.1 2Fe-2S iron-sulfur cluster binding domain-containing protein [Anaerolineae bacterium]MBT7326796.1 2Fe-2S iron-sulfur cluster binding domain-containing protein [Anaerolineae bacterium]